MLTTFVGSGLLFLIEPMVAKMILPKFGGAASVWTAAMVFFQVALLAGYGYAHLSVKWLGAKRQAVMHVALVLFGLVLLPISLPSGVGVNGSPTPVIGVIIALAAMAGVPFLLLAAGAPLVQKWFSHTKDPLARDPYFLYGASNLGCIAALLAYPIAVEPFMGLAEQARLWKTGYLVLSLLLAASAIFINRDRGQESEQGLSNESVKWSSRIRWIVLALIPSSLLLSVTAHVTTVIAPIPLLWVAPLVLYLLSFVLAFSRRPILGSKPLFWATIAFVALVSTSLLVQTGKAVGLQIVVHVAGLFCMAWACHRTLADERPSVSRLTEFYFWIATGGAIGGLFNSLVAPVIFNSAAEYPIALVALVFMLPRGKPFIWGWRDLVWGGVVGIVAVALMILHHDFDWSLGNRVLVPLLGGPIILSLVVAVRPVASALSLALVFLGAAWTNVSDGGTVVSRGRSFFGTHQVLVYGTEHRVVNGVTLHGIQDFQEAMRTEPMSYYTRSSPIGQLMEEKSKSGHKPATAVVGLGAGTMAAYGQPGQTFDFYEIDPTVVEMARNPQFFTYLSDCQANVRVILGDARISLHDAPPGAYDVIILDAFSSDAIPVHLLTREAVQMYLTKLALGGVIAFHISNNYLDLAPVVANLCHDLGLVGRDDYDWADPTDVLKRNSEWFMVARRIEDLGDLPKSKDWLDPKTDPGLGLWTDDRSSLLLNLIKRISQR